MASSSYDWLQITGIVFLAILLTRALVSISKGIYTCWLGSLLGCGVDWKKVKGWAAITGSSDGIGREYALQLAKKGFNIILISRTRSKLETVAQDIQSRYNVNTRIVVADFAKDVSVYDDIKKQIQDLPVGILVNNVGLCYDRFEFFTSLPNRKEFLDQLVKTNVYPALMMTEMILPQMEEHKSGIIINVASLSALHPLPLFAVYSATKAFMDYFSIALNIEYKKKGIIVQSVLPSFVQTKMITNVISSSFSNSAESYVSWALSSVGIERRTFGHPLHKLQAFFLELGYENISNSAMLNFFFYMALYLRRRAYKNDRRGSFHS